MREFCIDYKDTYIHAKLEMPEKSSATVPLVVVVHGLTGSMEEQQLVAVCEAANKADMASMRIELFGHGKSGGDFYKHSVSKWVEQIEYVMEYIRQQYDFSCIYLVGHSQGGLACLLAAPRIMKAFEKGNGCCTDNDKLCKLEGLVLMAPAVCIVTDAREGRFFGEPIEDIENPGDLTFWDEFTISGDYLKDAMTLPYEDAVKEYTGPVLIVHGTKDESVPFKDSEELAKLYLDVTFVPIENDLHCFDYHYDEMADAVYDFLKDLNNC